MVRSRTPTISIILLVILSIGDICCEDEEEVFVIDNHVDSSSGNGQQSGFPGHLVALRPDYTFWNMVDVLKTMFDVRTAEKRRPSRELEEVPPRIQNPDLRARRLLLNFGRFRF